MEYSAEDISPVRKKVVITTEAQEVEAAIMGAVALYKTSVQLDGFRKGKVPASVIEQRFRDKIYEEARQDLINVHINDVMQKLDVSPLAGVDVDGARGVDGARVVDRDIATGLADTGDGQRRCGVGESDVAAGGVRRVEACHRVRAAERCSADGNGRQGAGGSDTAGRCGR